jgi:hypothetical protein
MAPCREVPTRRLASAPRLPRPAGHGLAGAAIVVGVDRDLLDQGVEVAVGFSC